MTTHTKYFIHISHLTSHTSASYLDEGEHRGVPRLFRAGLGPGHAHAAQVAPSLHAAGHRQLRHAEVGPHFLFPKVFDRLHVLGVDTETAETNRVASNVVGRRFEVAIVAAGRKGRGLVQQQGVTSAYRPPPPPLVAQVDSGLSHVHNQVDKLGVRLFLGQACVKDEKKKKPKPKKTR